MNLDGDVEVEVSSGERRVIRRGEVFFVEDVTGEEAVLESNIMLFRQTDRQTDRQTETD